MMTAEQLRELAREVASGNKRLSDDEAYGFLMDHAAALEEIDRLKVMAASAHIERDVHAAMIIRAERAEAALAEAERRAERLNGHAEAMAARIEWYAEEGWVNGDIPEARAYRADKEK